VTTPPRTDSLRADTPRPVENAPVSDDHPEPRRLIQ
jgi:hypothetical protein